MTHLGSVSVRFALLAVFGAGLLWPLSTTLALRVAFPDRASGSMLRWEGRIVGSSLVGQAFTEDRYLWGRPSACGYDPRAAAGSNLAPSNPALRARAASDAAALGLASPPPEALAASGSGLDPHVSPAHAALQVGRVAAARGLPEQAVSEVIAAHTEAGWLGAPRVDVLGVNLALDRARSATRATPR